MTETSKSLKTEFELVTAALWFVPAALLLVALAPLPYGYYILVRFVVCGAAAFLAWKHFDAMDRFNPWTLILAIMALLFNPLIPVHLSRELWAPIDLLTAITFGAHYYVVRRGEGNGMEQSTKDYVLGAAKGFAFLSGLALALYVVAVNIDSSKLGIVCGMWLLSWFFWLGTFADVPGGVEYWATTPTWKVFVFVLPLSLVTTALMILLFIG